ncbi:MAG: cardiolipin synthase [Xylanivirga thermophila]|jgi:cardiolipin synthase A/B|uniref:cardiolipin synthase n=1 Tax=Xylanivirga thermophila TaxID=2496273 RepID=UPI0039F5AA38
MNTSQLNVSISNVNISLLLFIINICFAFVLVFLERRNPTVTWAWLLVFMFVPVIGFLLYLLMGQDLRKKKLFKAKGEDDIKKLAERHAEKLKDGRVITLSPIILDDKDIINLHFENSRSLLTQNNHVTILADGQQKFDMLIDCIKNAQHHIHMEYYIIRNDVLGNQIRDLLAQRAREGIEVRLLYDGLGCRKLPRHFFRPITQAGGYAYEFYPPFFPYINIRVNYRNHRKIAIIDGETAFIGGFNIGDEYLGKIPKFGYWRDTHLMLSGDSVDYLQLRFMMDWQFAVSNQHIPPFAEEYFPPKKRVGNTNIQIVSSGPDSQWESIRQGFFKMITKAQKNIYIQTPYFVPDDSIAEALKIAALGGIDVKIMIPCKPDHPFVYWASTSYIGELLEAGAKAYTYMNGFLHSKAVMVDGRIASVGTANMDIRSFKVNFEVNAFIYDPNAVNDLEQIFINDLSYCREITKETYKDRSLVIKFKESVSRLVSPLL